MGSRLDRFHEHLAKAQAELLRRHLEDLREGQRDELPPAPSAYDRALAARSSPVERARVDVLLVEAGYTEDDLARADTLAAPPSDDAPADELTRARARTLLGRKRTGPRKAS